MISYRRKKQRKTLPKLFVLLIYAFLSIAAVKAGVMFGNAVCDKALKDYIFGIRTNSFKNVLNISLPVINAVYNSGNVRTSISDIFKDVTEAVFGFDLNDPKSILKSNSAFISAYDVNFQQNISYDMTAPAENNDMLSNNDGIEPPKTHMIWENPTLEEMPVLKEAASSICMDYEPEERNIENKEVQSAKGIDIRNETKIKIDLEKLLNESLSFDFDRKYSKILIYHTHTTESYLKNLADIKKPNVLNRSSDPRYSVVRVGTELANNLKKNHGIEVIHNGTVHDYPDFNKSYVNSLKTVNSILKGNPSVKVVLDIHRDAIARNKLRLVKNVNGKNAAQIMLVVATGEAGANHPEWKENMKLALKLQKKLNDICPGLARPIYVSKYRYNQHVSEAALLVEMGGDGNLLDECLTSTKYLAEALNAVLSE